MARHWLSLDEKFQCPLCYQCDKAVQRVISDLEQLLCFVYYSFPSIPVTTHRLAVASVPTDRLAPVTTDRLASVPTTDRLASVPTDRLARNNWQSRTNFHYWMRVVCQYLLAHTQKPMT